ncbi:putative aspartyl aminopeptidase [Chlamydiales bacterium STE3]|nr:putative aspartyl aminopeptidase [Chlamydiales bacterium STE3]
MKNSMIKQSSKSDQLGDFLKFLENSPTAWHAVGNVAAALTNAHFEELYEHESWKLSAGKSYFVRRNGSSIIAFKMPKNKPLGANVFASHTDSPSLKLKPRAVFTKENMLMVGVEVYGAPLLSSWLNRDLGIAGRVFGLNNKKELVEALVNLQKAPVTIPQLAIHLDRKVNEEGLLLNKQDHLAALLGVGQEEDALEKAILQETGLQSLLSHDLFLYPLEPPKFLGLDHAFIAAYRLDSLASVFATTQAFLNHTSQQETTIEMMAFWDNEEVGSNTAQGAASPFLSNTLERILLVTDGNREALLKLLAQSFCVSIDLTHAAHPNYLEKSEAKHRVFLEKGVALKMHASQAYATNALTAAKVLKVADEHKVPIQHFISRSDMPSGSTIGPIHAALTGMPTVDLGIGQLSMHSARELIASTDYLLLVKLIEALLA